MIRPKGPRAIRATPIRQAVILDWSCIGCASLPRGRVWSGRAAARSPGSDLIPVRARAACMLEPCPTWTAQPGKKPGGPATRPSTASFFIGVRTTGVYCRCVCPVRLPFRRNIEFLPSAAAAEVAGFRPCLRCRPETAPFSPAWNGTRTTVERAARLIIEEWRPGRRHHGGSLRSPARHDGPAPEPAVRPALGCASPSIVARTARVQRAKRLLTETDLPMVEVAVQAGFGSLRRFNAVFSEVYKRPPSAIRRRCPASHP